MQQINIIGFIGRDASVKSQDEYFLINFSVACTEKWKDSKGESQERTNWYTIMKRSKNNSESLVEYLTKGQKVFVQGKPSFNLQQYNGSLKMEVVINSEKLQVLTFKD